MASLKEIEGEKSEEKEILKQDNSEEKYIEPKLREEEDPNPEKEDKVSKIVWFEKVLCKD